MLRRLRVWERELAGCLEPAALLRPPWWGFWARQKLWLLGQHHPLQRPPADPEVLFEDQAGFRQRRRNQAVVRSERQRSRRVEQHAGQRRQRPERATTAFCILAGIGQAGRPVEHAFPVPSPWHLRRSTIIVFHCNPCDFVVQTPLFLEVRV